MHYGWIIVSACLVIGVCGYGTYFSFTLFYEHLAAEFGWSRAVISGAMSVGLIAYGICSFPMGWCADRFGPRPTVVAGGLIFGLGTALGSAVTESWHLYALYGGLSAVGMGAVWSPLVATISRWFEARRGMAISIATLGGGAGTFFIAPLAGLLIGQLGWRQAYLWLGAISGGLVVLSALFLTRDPGRKGMQPYGVSGDAAAAGGVASGGGVAVTGSFLRDRLFWIMSLTFGLWWFAGAIIYVHIAPFVIEKGLESVGAATIVALFGAGNCIGRIAMGILCDRIGAVPTYRWSIGMSAMIMLAFAFVEEATNLYLLSVVLGVFVGGASTQISTVSVALFGTASGGALIGAVLALVGIVGAGGPVLSGAIFDASKSYAPAFHVGAAVFLLSLLLSITLKRR
ncbi:MAG: MFS transporter [Pseudomonadota bacterium]|nr:MFS transporter [Pseudomonadota bacterium]